MGVDTYALLPGNARVGTVAKVAGILLGCPPRRGAKWVTVDGAVVGQVEGLPECARIVIHPPGGEAANLLFHFESDSGRFEGGASLRRVSCGRSYARRIALARGLADFFGGRVIYNDCAAPGQAKDFADYRVPDKTDRENAASDGADWDALQERIFNVRPLTAEEVATCLPLAAYRE